MLNSQSPLERLRQRLLSGEITPEQIAADALAHSNSNAGHNVYIAQDQGSIDDRVSTLQHQSERPPLYAIPISLKDCFDLRDYVTTCGSRYYANINAPATEDSWIASQLKKAGAIITGKSHMHMLAYGITGQNPDYGDCLQPNNSAIFTGGSSSGAVASVQEGSALAAIGTDTGGSVRVPAALCGLAGFRASIDLGFRIRADIWAGGVHLAPSFDTLGVLFRDLRDGPAVAQAILDLPAATAPIRNPKIAVLGEDFIHDAEPEVREFYSAQQEALRSSGATLHSIDTSWWSDSLEVFVPIQANEAAHIQRLLLNVYRQRKSASNVGENTSGEDFSVFEAAIAQRLTWGESVPTAEIAALRLRHAAFQAKMDSLLTQYDLLLMPCAPIRQLRADADHSQTRNRILRYTAPISLAGMPAVTIPGVRHPGVGLQLAAPRGSDAALLAYAATLVV